MKLDLKVEKASRKYLILAVFGGLIAVLGFLTHAINPIQSTIDNLMTLQPGTLIHKLWTEPPYEVLAKIYIFNVTNKDRFLAGEEKLKLKEVGPYIYQEVLSNTESRLNENGTLTFKPRRKLIFRPDYSHNDPDKDVLVAPNIPLLGMASYIQEHLDFITNMGFSTLIGILGSKSMSNLTVTEYLFGVEDELVTLASKFIPSWIDFKTFGIIDRLMALDNGDNTVTIHLHDSESQKNNSKFLPYSINRFNGSPGLKQWGYKDTNSSDQPSSNTKCNTLEGIFVEGIFPREIPKNKSIGLYRRAFCRSVNMNYEDAGYSSEGIKYYSYRIDQDFLSYKPDDERTKCFCKKNVCSPRGFGSISPCYYDMPITMSQPHYYNADPEVAAQVDGLAPDKEKHDTVMKINPTLGIPFAANLRIQINLKLTENRMVKTVAPFKSMMLPLFWIELHLNSMPWWATLCLRMAPYAGTIESVTAWLLSLLGVAMVATAALLALYFPSHHRLEDPFGNRVGYSPILVLPLKPEVKRIS